MKSLGIGICVVGSLIAILFVPTHTGMGTQWAFIFGDSWLGVKNYQVIYVGMLLLELVLINGVGLAFFFVGWSRERK